MNCSTLRAFKKLPKGISWLHTELRPTNAAGDISSVFPSLSGIDVPPLPQRFEDIQNRFAFGRQKRMVDGWARLLASLKTEIKEIKIRGSHIIPSVDFRKDITVDSRTGQATFKDPEVIEEIRKRGAVVIRNVLDKDLARSYKF
ncbi:hypothetical protein V1523DRAFT_448372, partial [Lipomyces doorenjongii]